MCGARCRRSIDSKVSTNPSWTDRLPQVVVAVIKFEEGTEMISKVMGAGVLAVTFDDAVEVVEERMSAKATSV